MCTLRYFFALTALLVLLGCDDSKNIVSNGSFETPKAKNEYDTYSPGINLGAWEIHGAPVDLVRTYWNPVDGAQSINLRGGEARAYITQDLTTKPGKVYVLRFAIAGNPDGNNDKKIEVWWDDQLLDTISYAMDKQTRLKMGWKYIAFNVKAEKKTTKLRFAAAVNEPWGPTLDDVQVIPAK